MSRDPAETWLDKLLRDELANAQNRVSSVLSDLKRAERIRDDDLAAHNAIVANHQTRLANARAEYDRVSENVAVINGVWKKS